MENFMLIVITLILCIVYPPFVVVPLGVLAAVLVIGIPIRIGVEIYESIEQRRKRNDG